MVGLAGIVVVALEDPRVPPREALSVAVYASLTWLAGVALRQRSLRIARAEGRSAALERDHRETQAAVAEERARIARELHDVVAHSVSVMTVQAGAARMTLGTDPDRALEALLAVEETGRQALDELRRLLCILRPDQVRPDHIDAALVPQPGLDNLPELVESVRGTGLPVELVTDGVVRPVAPGLGLTAYRIVQEALTNTLKHAAAHQVRVLVNYGPQQLQVEVRDDGSRPSLTTASSVGQGGHGLAGMRERAALYGGEVHVGPGEDGGYLVSGRATHRTASTMTGDTIRVLVVDDQALVRGGFRLILDSQPDIEVVDEAADGTQHWPCVESCAPTSYSWMSGCPAWTGWRPPGSCAPRVTDLVS